MMLGSAIGIAIYQTLFSTFLTIQVSALDPEVIAIGNEYGALKNYLYIRKMPADAQGPVIKAYMDALHLTFTVPLCAAGISVIAVLFTRNVRYGSSPSQPQEKIDEENQRQPLGEVILDDDAKDSSIFEHSNASSVHGHAGGLSSSQYHHEQK